MHAAFFSQRARKPECGGRGTPGRKETPKLLRQALSRKAGTAAASRPGSPEFWSLRGAEGEGRGPRGLAQGREGRRPAARRGPRAGEGGPRQAAPRAQGASPRRPPGGAAGAGEGRPAECRLPPGKEMWGPGQGAGQAGSRWPGLHDPRPALGAPRGLTRLRAPPRGRLRGAAEARAQCGTAGPRRPGGAGGACPKGS